MSNLSSSSSLFNVINDKNKKLKKKSLLALNNNNNNWKHHYSKFMIVWSILSQTWLLIQTINIYVDKDASGVSLIAFVLLQISSVIWLVYASWVLPTLNIPIMMSSIIALTIGIALLTGIVLYK